MTDVKDATDNTADRQQDRRAADRAIPPEGCIVVPFQLPPITTRRWVARRKAEVVAAVHAGMLSALEACRRYRLSPEEFRVLQKGIANLRDNLRAHVQESAHTD